MKTIRKFFAWLGRVFRKAAPLPEPGEDGRVYITASKATEIIKQALAGRMSSTFRVRLRDPEYYCPSLQYVRRLLEQSKVDQRQYKKQVFDCDDFSVMLWSTFVDDAWRDGKRRAAHCAGIIDGRLPQPHAINWVITDDLKFRLIEPQNDSVYGIDGRTAEAWFVMA